MDAREVKPERCPACEELFPYLLPCPDDVARCWGCSREFEVAERRRAEGVMLLARLDTVVEGELRRAGLSSRERRSSLEAATPEILELARAEVLGAGVMPARGFGLSGPAGVGKTGMLAGMVRRVMRDRLTMRLPAQGGAALEPWLLWLPWPTQVNTLRVGSLRDGGLAEAEDLVARAASIEVLVLDDLGAERLRGTYEQDWAASQLDLIIDGRYRHDRPTWFTTHLSAGELIHHYGQRLFSRLCGENRLFEVKRTGDRRLREGRT